VVLKHYGVEPLLYLLMQIGDLAQSFGELDRSVLTDFMSYWVW